MRRLKYIVKQKSDAPKNNAVIILKIEQCDIARVMGLKDAEGMTNSVDPDQTAHSRAV